MGMKTKEDRTVKSLDRTKTHQIYRTTSGERVPGGSTLARTVSFGNTDSLIAWGCRLAEAGQDWQAVRQESAQLGTAFHRLVECRYTGERFPAEQYPPVFTAQATRMADSFANVLNALGLVIYASEQQIVSDRGRFGGTLDLVLGYSYCPEPTVLGDLKSSNFLSGEHVLQVAGFYRELFAERYGQYPDQVILFRADRDTGDCRGYVIPEEVVEAAQIAVPHVRLLYDLKKKLERRFS
jgi:hypothetical protein